jgi:hypothetical protein
MLRIPPVLIHACGIINQENLTKSISESFMPISLRALGHLQCGGLLTYRGIVHASIALHVLYSRKFFSTQEPLLERDRVALKHLVFGVVPEEHSPVYCDNVIGFSEEPKAQS